MMKHTIVLILFVSSAVSYSQQLFTVDAETEKKIDKIIKELTLQEKVGQTCQVTLDALLATDSTGKLSAPLQFDPEKYNEALCEYRIGSILNVSANTLSLDEWKAFLDRINNSFLNEKINVPIIYGIDAIHGVNYTRGATLFPQEIGLAATWNLELAKKFGEIVAYETRASGLRWNFSPVLDVARQPLWSRYFETLGEDSKMVSLFAKSIVLGYQGSNPSEIDAYHVATCLKHFVGYSMPFSGRDRTPAWIPEKYMSEIYLPPFEAAVKDGAMTLMINSGDVNGIPGHANRKLLTNVLKEEWGFNGFTVSDWEDFIMLETVHDVAANQQEAIAAAFNAGVDMSMVPLSPQYKTYCQLLVKCVEDGDVSMERLEDAVRRILRVKFALGLFDKSSYKPVDYSKFGSDEFKNAALQSALESITLLKNTDDILPLSKSTKVLVTGPTSNNLTFINGAWTHTWQGVDASFNTPNCETIYSAIANEIGSENCLFTQGAELSLEAGWEQCALVDTADFSQKAAQSDVIIVCLGELPSTEKPGDIHSLRLLETQIELAEMAYATGKKVVLVLVEARPRVIHSIVDGAAAIFQTYLPGDYGGTALAKLLFGDENPSGKLPYTYPKYDGVIEFYDHPKSVARSGKTNAFDAFDPEWEFGFGLSYTEFTYSNLRLDESKMESSGMMGSNQTVTVSVDVTNSGPRKGKEVVQLYVSDKKASIVPAGKRLVDFKKLDLAPNETQSVEFMISLADLMFADQHGSMMYEFGTFMVEINGDTLEFELK